MSKKQTNINILINILAFGIQFIINFYTAPILIGALGTEAYGFVGLANDFVSYLTIISTIFNSVAARFISYEIAKDNVHQAEKYFNSLLVTNFFLAVAFSIITAIVVPNVNVFFNVPDELLEDVQITFLITLIAYIVVVLTSIFTTATFVKNRLDISGARNIIQYLIRFVCILILLNTVEIHIYWIPVAYLIAVIVSAIMNIDITKKIMPEIHINIKAASLSQVKVLAASGSWLAITNISSILMRGLDLAIANLKLGAYDMGLLSVARNFPNQFTSVVATIAPIFTPVFVSLYAKKEATKLTDAVLDSIKKMGLIMIVPVTGFIVYSMDFYRLWQPSYSTDELRIIVALSTITVIQCYFNSTTSTMAQVSVVTNTLKLPVFVSLFCGVLNIVVVLGLLSFTDLGVYAIVISSTCIMVLRYVIFNSYYCAYLLKQNVGLFYKQAFRTWITIPIQVILMLAIKHFVPAESWLSLILSAMISGGLGYLIEFVFLEGKNSITICKRILNR